MSNQTNATLREVLSQVSSMEAIKLLPWCISTAVPLHCISEVATMATHQDKGISIASEPCPTAPEPESLSLLVPGPSGVLTTPPVMSPLPVFSIPDIPLDGTPLLGCSFAGLTFPPKGKWDHSPSYSPDHLHVKRTHVTSPEGEVGSERSSTWGDDHTSNPTPETRTDLDNNDESPTSLPLVPLEGWPTPVVMWQQAAPRILETNCPQTLVCPEEAQWALTWTLLLKIASPA